MAGDKLNKKNLKCLEIPEELKKIRWLLTKSLQIKPLEKKISNPYYGDITKLNKNRLIRDAVGEKLLADIVGDGLNLSNSSAIVYEKNGDIAYGAFRSAWCVFLDAASRRLCNTKDNKKALASGKWLCHASCWNVSSRAINQKKIIDTKCVGGINICSIPIYAGKEIVGAISYGYGNPPQDSRIIKKLALLFKVKEENLLKIAKNYDTRPFYIIGLAKKQFITSAKQIGEIVRRKTLENSLLESEKKFRNIFENSPIGKSLTKIDGTVNMNRAYCKMLGYSQKELIGKKWQEITPAEEVKPIENLLKQLQSGQKDIVRFTKRYIRKDGSLIFAELNVALQRDKNNKPLYYLTSAQDITARKKSEEENKKLLYNIQERNKELSCLYEISKIIEKPNSSLEEIFRKTADNIPVAYQYPEIACVRICYKNKKFTTKSCKKNNYKKINLRQSAAIKVNGIKKGSIEVCYLRKPSSGNNPIFLKEEQNLIDEIADRLGKLIEQKKIETKAKLRSVKYRRLFEAAQDGILIINAKTGKIIDSNPYIQKLLEYSRSELVGKEIFEISPLKNVIANKTKFRELQRKKHVQYNNLPLETKNGKELLVEFVSNVYPVDGLTLIQANIRDITAQKKAEEKLKVSELRYRRLFETAQDSILIIDAKTGKIIDSNPFIQKLLGYNAEELIGKRIFEISPLENIIPNKAKFKELQKNKYVRYSNLPLETKSRKIRWVEFVSNVYNVEKDLIIQANIRDITDQHIAENLLKIEKERAEKYLKIAGVLIVALDTTGNIVLLNQKGKEILGYKNSEIIGKNWFNTCLPKKNLKEVKGVFNKLMKGKGNVVEHYENPIATKKGEEKIISWYNSLLKDETGKIIGVISSGEDITERKKVEEELRKAKEDVDKQVEERTKELNESKQKYRLLYETSQDAIMTLEPPDWKFTNGNSATIKMFGVKDKKELSSLPPWELSPRYQPDGQLSSVKAKKMIKKAMKDGKNFFEWTHLRLNSGKTFPATVLLGKIEETAKTYLQATVRDITKEKKAEEEIKQKAKELALKVKDLEIAKVALANIAKNESKRSAELIQLVSQLKELDKLKDDFLNIITHELKTPLIPIHSQVQLLLDEDYGKMNEEQKRSIEMIYRNEKRLTAMVCDILDISKIQSKKFKIAPEKMSIEKIIYEIAEDLKPNAEEKNLKLIIKPMKLPKVFVDPKKINQVLGNLIINALKFTEKGTITIEAKEIENYVLVKVKDTGIGIDSKDMKKLFIPFSQIETGLTRKHGGTGLGLAICKGIIKKHHGKIWAKSEGMGKGSSFYFTIPLKYKKDPPPLLFY